MTVVPLLILTYLASPWKPLAGQILVRGQPAAAGESPL
jgi:hypothetical protein